jgi:hypothetical protein
VRDAPPKSACGSMRQKRVPPMANHGASFSHPHHSGGGWGSLGQGYKTASEQIGRLAPVSSGLGATGLRRAKGLFGAKAIGRHCAPASVTISQLGAKCLTDLNFEGAGSSAINARMSG